MCRQLQPAAVSQKRERHVRQAGRQAEGAEAAAVAIAIHQDQQHGATANAANILYV
jgi:hypothetical protein